MKGAAVALSFVARERVGGFAGRVRAMVTRLCDGDASEV